MKKLIALISACALALSLTACSGSKNNTPNTNDGSNAGGSTSQSGTPSTGVGDFPSETITIVCPYSAGGGTDIGARNMATVLSDRLGVNVVVENQTGAAGWIAWTDMITGGYDDGYRMCLLNHNFVFGELDDTNPREYNLDDIQLLCNQALDYNVMAIRTNETRFSDLNGFIEYAKANPVLIACQDTGILDGDATTAEWFNQTFGTQITPIPVDGASDSRGMFLAGDTDILFGSISDVLSGYQNGEMNVACLFADERSDFMPDVPTVKEVTGERFVGFAARGYFYPKGVPAEIVEFMTETMLEAQKDPAYIENMTTMGLQVDTTAGEDYAELLASQMETRLAIWGK